MPPFDDLILASKNEAGMKSLEAMFAFRLGQFNRGFLKKINLPADLHMYTTEFVDRFLKTDP